MDSFNAHGGHNPDGKIACGACSLIKESTEDRKVCSELIDLLRNEGKICYDTTVNNGSGQQDVLNKIIAKCNEHIVDLDISIHFNSGANDVKGNGETTGVEVFCYDSRTYEVANRVCKEISKLGFKNRGVKYDKRLRVLAETKSLAILVECCFVDDADDVKDYNYKTMAKAIAQGILNKKIETETKEDFDMNKIVLYYGDADLFSAVLVSQKNKCPIMKKSDFYAAKLKAKEIIQIGGNKEDSNRFVTMKNACKYL